MNRIKTVLSIAGSDPSSGAGIQADLKTCSSLGTYALTLITALTAQNTQAVDGIFPVSTDFIRQQFDTLIHDIKIDAIKIGMLHDVDVIQTIDNCLSKINDIPIVLDPVMVSTSNDRLLSLDAIDSLKTLLIPKATLITPNLTEACCLTGATSYSPELLEQLSSLGPKAILVKDVYPHSSKAEDVLYLPDTKEQITLTKDKIDSKHTHGTGCSLSSAIASYMAQGETLTQATTLAKDYVFHAIDAAQDLGVGQGNGPLQHFHTRRTHETTERD